MIGKLEANDEKDYLFLNKKGFMDEKEDNASEIESWRDTSSTITDCLFKNSPENVKTNPYLKHKLEIFLKKCEKKKKQLKINERPNLKLMNLRDCFNEGGFRTLKNYRSETKLQKIKSMTSLEKKIYSENFYDKPK